MNDSIERIKADSLKFVEQYWNCENAYNCIDCPSKIDVKTPYEYYETSNCLNAMNLDLIERTVEVIKCNVERTTTRNKTKKKYGRDVPVCECCGYSIGDKRYNFCPNCGAKVVE